MIRLNVYAVQIPTTAYGLAKGGVAEKHDLTPPTTPVIGTAWRATVDNGSFFAICDAKDENLAIGGALRVMADHFDAKAKGATS